jgi:hypothetical protein
MNNFLNIILAYVKEQWIWALLIGYELVAMAMGIFTHYDIAIPCISQLIFHKECPGCGLTRGTMCMLQGEFEKAASFNRGVFVVIPLIVGLVIYDFFEFKNKRLPLLLSKKNKTN